MARGGIKMNPWKLTLMVLVHPKDAFPLVKSDRDEVNYAPAIILMTMLIIVKVASIYIVHYPLALLEPRNTNLVLEVIKMLLPLLTWVLSCYAITSILNGESLIGEIFIAAAYAMLPYIFLMIPIGLLSKILTGYEAGFYYTLQAVIWIWTLSLFFVSVQSMNDYSFKEALGIIILSVIGVVLIWILLALFYAISKHFTGFIQSIVREIQFIYTK